jgi:hypothetical protein
VAGGDQSVRLGVGFAGVGGVRGAGLHLEASPAAADTDAPLGVVNLLAFPTAGALAIQVERDGERGAEEASLTIAVDADGAAIEGKPFAGEPFRLP